MGMLDEVTYLPPMYVFAPIGSPVLTWAEILARQIAQEGALFQVPYPPPLALQYTTTPHPPYTVVSPVKGVTVIEQTMLTSAQDAIVKAANGSSVMYKNLDVWKNKVVLTGVRSNQTVIWSGDLLKAHLKYGRVAGPPLSFKPYVVDNLLADVQRRIMPPSQLDLTMDSLRRSQSRAIIQDAVYGNRSIPASSMFLYRISASEIFYDPGVGLWLTRKVQ